jgi:hypothetical protein
MFRVIPFSHHKAHLHVIKKGKDGWFDSEKSVIAHDLQLHLLSLFVSNILYIRRLYIFRHYTSYSIREFKGY